MGSPNRAYFSGLEILLELPPKRIFCFDGFQKNLNEYFKSLVNSLSKTSEVYIDNGKNFDKSEGIHIGYSLPDGTLCSRVALSDILLEGNHQKPSIKGRLAHEEAHALSYLGQIHSFQRLLDQLGLDVQLAKLPSEFVASIAYIYALNKSGVNLKTFGYTCSDPEEERFLNEAQKLFIR